MSVLSRLWKGWDEGGREETSGRGVVDKKEKGEKGGRFGEERSG